VTEAFDDVVTQYIDFVNQQVGAYMDALAGFAGHYARVERQVHRVNRPVRSEVDDAGRQVVVWASYEDPTKPDVIHNRIIRAEDYLAVNAPGGSNEQQHARAIVVFLFTYWEDEIRQRLAKAKGVPVNEVRCDAMGDLRVLRNVILHSKSVMRADKHAELKQLGSLFTIDEPLALSYENMQKIFVAVKRDCGQLMLDWLGVKDAPLKPEEIADIAIQKNRRATQA